VCISLISLADKSPPHHHRPSLSSLQHAEMQFLYSHLQFHFFPPAIAKGMGRIIISCREIAFFLSPRTLRPMHACNVIVVTCAAAACKNESWYVHNIKSFKCIRQWLQHKRAEGERDALFRAMSWKNINTHTYFFRNACNCFFYLF
jgi:hypothetical protein